MGTLVGIQLVFYSGALALFHLSGCKRVTTSIPVQRGEWGRLFWGTVLHADAMHLYYNMSSLLFKGVQLEPALGSVGFGLLITELWVLCSVLYCAVQWGS